jgi:hypothetical protein
VSSLAGNIPHAGMDRRIDRQTVDRLGDVLAAFQFSYQPPVCTLLCLAFLAVIFVGFRSLGRQQQYMVLRLLSSVAEQQ